MKALLLAAGRSKRAKPIEDKNFLKFCGKTLLEFQLESLHEAGFNDVLIAAGVHNLKKVEQIAKTYGALVIRQDDLDEGMAGAILAAAPYLDDALMIVSGNDIVDVLAYSDMLKARKSGADAYILARQMDTYFPGGYLKVEEGRIVDIIEKPGEGNEPSNLVNIVLHFFMKPSSLISAIQSISTDKDDRYEQALASLMKKQVFEAVIYEKFWQPVKFPWHVLDLMPFFLDKMQAFIHPSAEIASTAILKGKIYIEEGVKIFDHAIIQGPVYVGKNTVIANQSLLRQSILGENCVLGFGTEIARSFIGDDVWFHSNYIGDTVMGNNNSFGAGAICANLRLDEKEILSSKRNKLGPILGDNIRVGVNASLMPGIKIGSNTMIASGTLIDIDIPAGKFVSLNNNLNIRNNRVSMEDTARSTFRAAQTPHLH